MDIKGFGWRDYLMFGLVLVLAWSLYRGFVVQQHNTAEGQQAHSYLCYQKLTGLPKQIAAVNEKIQTSLDYINDVQTGKREAVPGITFSDIQRGIEANQADIARYNDAIRALGRVHC